MPIAPTIGLKTHIWNNNAKSLALLFSFPVIFFGMVWLALFCAGGLFFYGMSSGQSGNFDWAMFSHAGAAFANMVTLEYWPLILGAVFAWFTIAYIWNGRIVGKFCGAHFANRSQDPALYNLLETLCISRGLPMPYLQIIENDALNAFASGIDDRTYTITVTRGLMNTLPEDELEAVLAHELTHIINRDVRLMMVATLFTGIIGLLAQMAWRHIRYMRFFGRSRGGGKNAAAGLVMYLVVLIILSIGYLLTMSLRFMISRSREYMADAGAIELTKNPEAMIRALQRISQNHEIKTLPSDVQAMCIHSSNAFMGLFSTHPPLPIRLAAISETTGTPIVPLPGIERSAENTPEHIDMTPDNPWD